MVLDRTAFYAESGGQPSDRGTLGGVEMLAALHDGDEVVHLLAAPLGDAPVVQGRVDADRRRDHLQQHHGQHLLSRAFVETADAPTVSFHLGAEASTIDLSREVGDAQVRAAEARTNAVIWEGRPVTVRTVSRADALAMGVTPPADAGDEIRIVDAEGFDRQPCGGTHPRTTSEVGVVVISGHERYKGGSRVRFLCGERAVAAFRQRTAILTGAAAVFSSSFEDLPAAAQRTAAALSGAEQRIRALTERALEAEARRLAADFPHDASGAASVIQAQYADWPAADLRALALHLVRLTPCVALVAGTAEGRVHLVFAQSEGLTHDIPALLRAAAAAVGGRGGGRGNLAQGGGDRPEQVKDALAAAVASIAGAAAS